MRIIPIFLLPIALSAAVTYSYDAAGRLTRIDYGTPGSITYAYDKSGNLLSRTVSAAASSAGRITKVNTASVNASEGIAQNTWTEIHGANIVPATTPAEGVFWSGAPEFARGQMPTSVGGVSVTVNGKPAYVWFYCSAATSSACADDQINVLTPLDTATGDVSIVVTNPNGSTAPFTAAMKPVVPSILRFDIAGHVVARHADFSLLGPASLYPGLSTPAHANEQVLLYGTGFGLPSSAIAPGSASQAGSLPTLPVCKVGGDPAPVAFAGLVGPGLIQLNVIVPSTAASADDKISCTYNGGATQIDNVITVQ